MIDMVKLKKWEDINKALFRRHIPKTISARELFVFRQFELVFSGKRTDAEAHQCMNCGQLFLITKERIQDAEKDYAGDPVCPKCAGSIEDYEDLQWRQKFELFRKLTKAIQALERSSPKQRTPLEKEVRDLSHGLFTFKDMKELYEGYWKLMNELGASQDYDSKLKKDWRLVIQSLFKRAKESDLVEFIKFAFSPDPNETMQIKDTIWQSNLSVIRMEKDYFLSKVSEYPILIGPITREDLARSRLKAQLLLYCHLIELDVLYDVSMNLAKVAKGEKFQKKPFSSSTKYPLTKINSIAEKNRELGLILKNIYCREVRNAFAHSKYNISGNYFIKTDEDFKMAIEDLQEKIDLLNAYWGFLYWNIGQEQVWAMSKGQVKTKKGDEIRIDVGWKDNSGSLSPRKNKTSPPANHSFIVGCFFRSSACILSCSRYILDITN